MTMFPCVGAFPSTETTSNIQQASASHRLPGEADFPKFNMSEAIAVTEVEASASSSSSSSLQGHCESREQGGEAGALPAPACPWALSAAPALQQAPGTSRPCPGSCAAACPVPPGTSRLLGAKNTFH